MLASRLPGLRALNIRNTLAATCHRLGARLAPPETSPVPGSSPASDGSPSPEPLSPAPVEAKPLRLDELELVEAESCGLKLWGVRGDFTGIYLEANVLYEHNVIGPILEDAKRAKTVIDAGSNVGLIALPVARAMPRGGMVHCFDISQRNCRILSANARRNGIDNIAVYPAGAGDAFAGFSVAVNRGSTLQTLSAVAKDYFGAVEMSLTVPLDAVFADGDKVDILKIDTDGYEYRVLKGARRLLREHRPIVYLEYCERTSMDHLGVPGPSILEILQDRSASWRAARADRGRPADDRYPGPDVPARLGSRHHASRHPLARAAVGGHATGIVAEGGCRTAASRHAIRTIR